MSVALLNNNTFKKVMEGNVFGDALVKELGSNLKEAGIATDYKVIEISEAPSLKERFPVIFLKYQI